MRARPSGASPGASCTNQTTQGALPQEANTPCGSSDGTCWGIDSTAITASGWRPWAVTDVQRRKGEQRRPNHTHFRGARALNGTQHTPLEKRGICQLRAARGIRNI